MRHSDRARPLGHDPARNLFTRMRDGYAMSSPGVRRGLTAGVFAATAALLLVLTGSLGSALIYAVLLVGFVLLALHRPPVAATVLVLLGWGMMLPVFGWAFGGPAGEPMLLMLLGLIAAVCAHLINWVSPWLTTLMALAAAGALALAFAGLWPVVALWIAYAAAACVLGVRFAQARRARAAVLEGERRAAYGEERYGGPHERVRESAEVPRRSYHESARQAEKPPPVSVEEALAELEDMIGLVPVKEQVRSIAASIEADRLRARAGYSTESPLRHFVFVGPPGTGKTSVARSVAKIFYAFGLLERPNVVEAHRADLVGEFLGATAIKTNELVDRALGGVLFVDEAYSLMNTGDGQTDRFGAEAVQALLKRAEDDRDNLVIILAGYEKEMADFLSSNPGLASRFATRVRFPSYSPDELLGIAELRLERREERLAADAVPALRAMFEDVRRRGTIDELGNARFVRTLMDAAARARDVRVVGAGGDARPEELVTIRAVDTVKAFQEITVYQAVPTLAEALADLDRMAGLEPVKRQVKAIAAQLRVAKMRESQGLPTAPMSRHFVFAGPPGTGKTTVARVLGRIFAALGLLSRTEVVEAHRADLVGQHLGSTAIKTNELVDRALGGVLFIDEAYSLVNPGYSGGDAFGAEAVQTLLKRAEDDRNRLVVILAGYRREMESFLTVNPGLASRFNSWVNFPSYAPAELTEIAEVLAQEAGDRFEPDALRDLDDVFSWVCGERLIDDWGNGRFARSLLEKAAMQRDVRLAARDGDATADELTTITSADVRAAVDELGER
ncbi:AAA family ATPase [Rhizohabitans arisaemae]|uniref:AAA family ATPase n=1 Tax=Rhizohabitans arisaemae TaxID=2720610 RepID=UPI0024B27645|nr:AAA family ATPase [Rhizohabitans arisaemae]